MPTCLAKYTKDTDGFHWQIDERLKATKAFCLQPRAVPTV